MSRTVWASLGLAVCLAGCGGSGPQGVLPAPHGGTLVLTPDGKSYVEVVKRSATGQPMQVGFYFLDLNRGPLAAPKAATLKIREMRNAKPVDLKPTGDGGLDTPPLPNLNEIEGELQYTAEGQPVSTAINVR